MIQAPSAAFVIATIDEDDRVTMAPNPLTTALVRQPGSRSRPPVHHHPDCDSVNETKTPIM